MAKYIAKYRITNMSGIKMAKIFAKYRITDMSVCVSTHAILLMKMERISNSLATKTR